MAKKGIGLNGFRIRSNGEVDDSLFQECELKYRNHLASCRVDGAKDLLRFFGNDFFHDGQITDIRFSPNAQDVSFRVEATNIWKVKDEKWQGYIPAVGFTCSFRGVAQFSITCRRLNRLNDPLDAEEDSLEFDMAEIDSLTEEVALLEANFKKAFHSLVIKTMPYQREITILFQDVLVTADEVVAFELLQSDPGFRCHLYERDEN